MEEKFVKAARILERLSEETFGPNDNWSIPGMQLHRAKNGNEDAKTSICLMVGASVGLSAKDVERVFDSLYGGTNENKQHKTNHNMKKTIRLSESDFHRVIRESVKRVLRENSDYPPSEFGEVWDGLSNDASVYCTPEEIEMYNKIGNGISDLYDDVTVFYDHVKELRYSKVAKQLEGVINMIKQIFPNISDVWTEFVGTKNAIEQQQERGYLYGKQSADFGEAENGWRAAGY